MKKIVAHSTTAIDMASVYMMQKEMFISVNATQASVVMDTAVTIPPVSSLVLVCY